tara:strand:+ start:102 stop:425 length:324 start_codon:yes stop_codon:yes gene_type:complete
MKARLDKQHRANAKKGNKMRNTRRNHVNKNMKTARNSGKFGSDLTNARVSMRGLTMPPRPKSRPPPPPRNPSCPPCPARGAGKRRRRRKTKRRRTKRRRRTRRRRRR